MNADSGKPRRCAPVVGDLRLADICWRALLCQTDSVVASRLTTVSFINVFTQIREVGHQQCSLQENFALSKCLLQCAYNFTAMETHQCNVSKGVCDVYTISKLICSMCARTRFHCANALVVLRSCASQREHWSPGSLRDLITTVNLNRTLGYFKFPEEN